VQVERLEAESPVATKSLETFADGAESVLSQVDESRSLIFDEEPVETGGAAGHAHGHLQAEPCLQ
jgi:hypothetical protein